MGINDADYKVGTHCMFYRTWHSMLKRCYNPTMLKNNPTYVGCSVAPEWLLFSNFKKWMELQNWQGKQLDKDLLVPGNKVYGPSTCIFVSHKVNGLLCTQPRLRGELPLGVTSHGNRYRVSFKKDRKTVHAGVFNTIEEASAAYAKEKADWIDHVADQETCPITKSILRNAANNLRKSI